MKYLLDTHILIWWLLDLPQLKPEIRKIIEEEKIFVSDVSILEIVIKRKKGNLFIEFDVESMLQENDFELLPIITAHILQTENFDSIHGDPFDRLLVAQSYREKMTFITHDSKLWQYPVALLRA